jgi:hypothetical protein
MEQSDKGRKLIPFVEKKRLDMAVSANIRSM